MRYKATVYTRLRPEYQDTIGLSLHAQLRGQGFTEVQSVHVGKKIEVEFEAEPDKAQEKIEDMCKQLLAHPVTDQFTIELNPFDIEPVVRAESVPEPIIDMNVDPPRFYEEDNNVKVFDLCRHHRLEFGPIRFTRADYKEHEPGRFPFCVRVFYSIYSYDMPLPVRLDLDKRSFLDDFDYRGRGMGTLAIYDMRERYEAILKIDAARMVASVVRAGLHAYIRKG